MAFTDGKPLRVHNAPSFGAPVLVSLPEGSLFHVVSGPKCVGGFYWWNISTEALNGEFGWVAESQAGVYLVEPVAR